MGFLDICDELAERGQLGNDSAMMEYTNKLALSAFSFAGSEGRIGPGKLPRRAVILVYFGRFLCNSHFVTAPLLEIS